MGVDGLPFLIEGCRGSTSLPRRIKVFLPSELLTGQLSGS